LGSAGRCAHQRPAEFMRHYLPPVMIATMERHQMWTESLVTLAPMATSLIMTNNLSVCFAIFAGGITFGLGTFFYLYENGMLLGVVGAACHQYGMSVALWSFVAPTARSNCLRLSSPAPPGSALATPCSSPEHCVGRNP